MNARSFYRPFFLLYGGAHVLGGMLLWAAPSASGILLAEPLSAAGGVLAGFASLLGGLGFGAGAFAETRRARSAVVAAALLADVVNFAAHATNVARGDSPGWLLAVAGLGTGAFLVALVALAAALWREGRDPG